MVTTKHKCKCGLEHVLKPGYGYSCSCGRVYKFFNKSNSVRGCPSCAKKRVDGGVHRFYQFKEK